MKKLRLTLVVALLAVVTAASAQMNLGVKGGLNMSNFVYGDEVTDKNMKIGFHIGLAADYDFAYNMAIQTGLFFTTKGSTVKYEGLVDAEYKENLMYLQLPIHLAYKLDVSPGTRIVFHGGPYAAYGVAGKRTAKVGSISGEWDVDKMFGDAVGQYKPFDAGLGIGVGAEFGRFLVDLGWDFGLVNISNRSNGNTKNQNAYLSVGVKF
ncbi:MAG: porin family protein [Bacteroidia bacterium]|nr:porin family protein [Bacteroidia bacterium]